MRTNEDECIQATSLTKAVLTEKADEIKALKKEKSEAESELKAKQKDWKKKEGALNKATNILKQMEKAAK